MRRVHTAIAEFCASVHLGTDVIHVGIFGRVDILWFGAVGHPCYVKLDERGAWSCLVSYITGVSIAENMIVYVATCIAHV